MSPTVGCKTSAIEVQLGRQSRSQVPLGNAGTKDAINNAVGTENPLSNHHIAELRHHPPGERMPGNRLGLVDKLPAKMFGGGIVGGNESDDFLQVPERQPRKLT